MISVSGISKRFGTTRALNDISFSVGEHQVLGLLGENGAGKTTLLNILSGFMEPDEGTVTIGSLTLDTAAYDAKRLIGYLPETPPLYTDMTVREYIGFCIDLKEVIKKDRQRHLDNVVALTGLRDVVDRRIGFLSHGYQQRIGLAQALAGDPPVLLLDEPTNGFDPSQIVEFRRLITLLSAKHTIILSSHILSLIQSMCGRIIVLHQGRLVADRCIDTESPVFSVILAASSKTVLPLIREMESVQRVSSVKSNHEQTELLVETTLPEQFPRKLFLLASARQIPILHLARRQDTLEEIYIRAIKGQEDASV